MTRVRLASGGWLGPRTWRAFRSPGSAPLVPLPWFRAPGSAPVVLRFLVVQDGGGSAGKIRLTSHFSNISHSASCRTIVARAPGGIGKRAPRESEPRVRREKSEPRVRREESEPRVRREDRRTAGDQPHNEAKKGPGRADRTPRNVATPAEPPRRGRFRPECLRVPSRRWCAPGRAR